LEEGFEDGYLLVVVWEEKRNGEMERVGE